jgi:hypothetical protein
VIVFGEWVMEWKRKQVANWSGGFHDRNYLAMKVTQSAGTKTWISGQVVTPIQWAWT